jgi:putative tryptophan/tyrosine transport system substrate-binding protein
MRRRDLILGLLVVATIDGAQAEQSAKVYRIAYVHPVHPAAQLTEANGSPTTIAVLKELRRLGYIEGRNLVIERYSGEGRAARYPELARDVVRRNPDVIIAIDNSITLDFKAATATIPIVGVFGNPLGAGIVSNLARPGGNITGVSTDIGQEQWEKRAQLLRQVAPQATRLGILLGREYRDELEPALLRVQGTGVTWVGPPLDPPFDEAEYRRVFAALTQEGAQGIIVTDEPANVRNIRLIVELAEKGRLPAIYPYREFVEAGGLMNYGIEIPALGRRAADMAVQILKGAKPSEIPIFLPTKFEMLINLKTAKSLGLTVPHELLVSADEVIE